MALIYSRTYPYTSSSIITCIFKETSKAFQALGFEQEHFSSLNSQISVQTKITLRFTLQLLSVLTLQQRLSFSLFTNLFFFWLTFITSTSTFISSALSLKMILQPHPVLTLKWTTYFSTSYLFAILTYLGICITTATSTTTLMVSVF